MKNIIKNTLGVIIFTLIFMDSSVAQEIEEVIVTAQKREQKLIDVPLTVTVLNEEDIEKARIKEFDDVVLLTPGLEFGEIFGRANGSIAIRGVAPATGGDPTVLVFVDGFTIGDSRSTNNSIQFDLERIEVLKGPQATLYGRNAMGGVINYITKKPDNNFEARVRASAGNLDDYELTGLVSGPIMKDKLYGRLTLTGTNNGGFLDNEYDGSKNVNEEVSVGGRGVLRFTPIDNFESILRFSYQNDDDSCNSCPSATPDFDITDPGILGRGEMNVNRYNDSINQDFLGGWERKNTTVVWENGLDFDQVTIKSITGYAKIDSHLQDDLNRAPGLLSGLVGFDGVVEREVWSEEIRLSSATDGRFSWQLGGFIYQLRIDDVLDFILPVGTAPLRNVRNSIDNYAIFGDITYAVTDKINLGIGLRYDVEERGQNNIATGVKVESDIDEILPRFSLSYTPAENWNFYATAAKGYKSGGFNPIGFQFPTFDPEFVWHYELGVKHITSDRKFSYDVAIFHIDWDDQQIQTSTATTTATINAASSTVEGIEASMNAYLTEKFEVGLSMSYIDAEFDIFIDNSSNPAYFMFDNDYSGNQVPLTPKFSGALVATYTHPLEIFPGWESVTRLDYRYTGKRNLIASDVLKQNEYHRANLSLAFESDKLAITGYVDNLFDEGYHVGAIIGAGVRPLLLTAPPRTYGVTIDISF